MSNGGATNISVDSQGNPFVTNEGGNAYWDSKIKLKQEIEETSSVQPLWKQRDGSVRSKDIGVGGGQVWIVGKDGNAYQMINGRW